MRGIKNSRAGATVLSGVMIGITASFITAFFASPASGIIGRWAPDNLTKISTRNFVGCAIDSGKLFCWGGNTYGQLGNNNVGVNSPIVPPASISGLLSGKTVTDVAAGGDAYVCAIADGKPYCWGRNRYNQLGNNDATKTDQPVPVAVYDGGVLSGKTATKIASGDGHACVVANSSVYCWGVGGNGRLGTGNQSTAIAPIAVVTTSPSSLGGKSVSDINIGSGHTCAIATDITMHCWGANAIGQLGIGTTADSYYAALVDTSTSSALNGKTITSIAIGSMINSTCAVASGVVACWGSNALGSLGIGSADSNPHPYPLAVNGGALSGKTASKVWTGNNRSCALTTSNEAVCWATYSTGGSPTSSNSPVAVLTSGVLNGKTLTEMASGDMNCARTATQVFCWGDNSNSKLGDNTAISRNYPVEVLASDNLTNTSYRLYKNTDTAAPGPPLADTNTPATLNYVGQPFRVRMGVQTAHSSETPIDLRTNDAALQLQFAARTAATCSAQTTGFTDVTASSVISYNTNPSVSNGATISASSNDPTMSSPIVYQTYQSAVGPFNNTSLIPKNSAGLWDFSLKDNGAPASTTYCLKLIYGVGTDLEQYTTYAEIKTADGEISVTVVDANGNNVTSPSYSMTNVFVMTNCQTSTGTLGSSTQKIRLTNSLNTGGWSLSLAATDGPSALWSPVDNSAHYDYNDPSGSPAGCNSGSDGDGYAGQLSINPSTASINPMSSCSTTGVTSGVLAAYEQSITNSITIASASSAADYGCYWDISGVNASQVIPPAQTAGDYSINMTLTAVAQ